MVVVHVRVKSREMAKFDNGGDVPRVHARIKEMRKGCGVKSERFLRPDL